MFPTSEPTGQPVRFRTTPGPDSHVRAGPRRRWLGRWVGAGSRTGRWVEYVPGNISRLPLRNPAPGSPAVLCGLPVRGATTRGALGGLAVAVEGAGSPNAPTQRALGRENCPLGPRSGAGSPPSRSPLPFPSSPLLFLPPLFSPSLPRRRHGRYAAGKKFEGRWVIRRALGACDWPPNGRWVGRWVVSLWGGVGWVLGPATECRRLRVQLRGALGAIPPWVEESKTGAQNGGGRRQRGPGSGGTVGGGGVPGSSGEGAWGASVRSTVGDMVGDAIAVTLCTHSTKQSGVVLWAAATISGSEGGGDDVNIIRRRRRAWGAAARWRRRRQRGARRRRGGCPPRLGWAARSDFDYVPSAPGHLAGLRCTKSTLLQKRTQIGRLPACFVRAPAARKIRILPSSEGM